MSEKEISEGDKVQWNYGAGHPKGTVTEIQSEPDSKIQIETKNGNTITRNGDESNPAVKVDRKGEGSGQDVVKKMSELTKVDGKDDEKKDNGSEEEEPKDSKLKGDEGGEDKGKKEPKVGDKRPLPLNEGHSGDEVKDLGQPEESKGDSSSTKSGDQKVNSKEDEGKSKEQVEKDGSDKDKQDGSEVKEPETKKPKLDSEHQTDLKDNKATSTTTENSKLAGRGRGRGRARAKTTASTTTGNRRSTRGKKDNGVDKDKPVEEVTMNDSTGPEESGSVEQGADIPVEEAPAGNTRSQK